MKDSGLSYLSKYEVLTNELVLDKDGLKIGVTIYMLEPGQKIDVSFWKRQAILGQAICMGVWQPMPEWTDVAPSWPPFYPLWLGTQLIALYTGYDTLSDPNDTHWLSVFSENVYKLSYDFPRKLFDAFGPKMLSDLGSAISESVADYAAGSGKKYIFQGQPDVERFIVSLHQYNQPEKIFMTMRVDVNRDNIVEHRHIHHSLVSMIDPLIRQKLFGENNPLTPQRLSMFMHTTAITKLTELGVPYKQLVIEPMVSMIRILKKSGLVDQDLEEFNGKRIVFEGESLKKLYNYEKTSRESVVISNSLIGNCISCNDSPQWKCAHCEQPILCNDCQKINIHECE